MSKKMLAALFAAAFLVSGGMAVAGQEYAWDGAKFVGTPAPNLVVGSDITVAVDTGVTANTAAINVADSAAMRDVILGSNATLNVGATNAGAVTGANQGFTLGVRDIKYDGSADTVAIWGGYAVEMTGNATLGAGDKLTIGSYVATNADDAVFVNKGTLTLNSATAELNLVGLTANSNKGILKNEKGATVNIIAGKLDASAVGANEVINEGTFKLGSDADLSAAPNTAFVFTNAGSPTDTTKWGTVEVAGDAGADISEVNALLAQFGADVGNIKITGKIEETADFDGLAASAMTGKVTIEDAQGTSSTAYAKNINVGEAELEFKDDSNNISGTIDGGKITFSGNTGTYGGVITGKKGVVVSGSSNEFDAAVNATVSAAGANADFNIAEGATNNVFNDVVNADRHVIIEGEDSVFNGLVTAGANGKDGNVDIKADAQFYAGVTAVATTPGTAANNGFIRVNDDVTATIAGTASGKLTVASRGTLEVTNVDSDGTAVADLTIDGSLTTVDGATIAFSDNDPTGLLGLNRIDVANAPGQDEINLTSGTNLYVDDSLGNLSDEILFTAAAKDEIAIDGKNRGNDAAILAYLNNQSMVTMGAESVYTLDNLGNIIYSWDMADTQAKQDANFGKVLASQNMTGYEDMFSQVYKDTLHYYANGTGDMSDADVVAMGRGRDQYVASLLKSAAGNRDYYDVSGDRRSAYALHQYLNGEDIAGALEAVTDTVRNFNRAILNRAYNIGHLMDSPMYDECGNPIDNCAGYTGRVWAGYTGQWDKNKGRDWNEGYKYDAHGFNIGYDQITSSGVGFGAAFGYSKGNYENKAQLWGDKSKIHNYSFGLFGSYNHSSGWFSMLSANYTYSKYKMNNGFADGFDSIHVGGYDRGWGYDYASFHGSTWSFGGKTGFDWKPMAARGLTITPTIGIYYYNTKTNTFDSTYRNDMKYKRHTIEMPIDVTAKYDFEIGCDSTLSLIATGGYAYNFNNKGTKVNQFTLGDNLNNAVAGDQRMPKPGRSSWNVGGGAQYRYRNFDVGVHYEYYGRKDFTSHSLFANVGVSF